MNQDWEFSLHYIAKLRVTSEVDLHVFEDAPAGMGHLLLVDGIGTSF